MKPAHLLFQVTLALALLGFALGGILHAAHDGDWSSCAFCKSGHVAEPAPGGAPNIEHIVVSHRSASISGPAIVAGFDHDDAARAPPSNLL